MKPDHNDAELLTRWIDGELDEAGRVGLETSMDAASRSSFDAEAASAQTIGGLLRDTYPAACDVSGPELFMHQLAHRLDRAEEPVARSITPGRALPMAGWLAAAAAVALGLFAAGRMLPRTSSDALTNAAKPVTLSHSSNILLASYVPDASVRVDASYNEDVDAVVIVLDGLKPINTPEDLVGFQAGDPRSGTVRLVGQPQQQGHNGGSSDS